MAAVICMKPMRIDTYQVSIYFKAKEAIESAGSPHGKSEEFVFECPLASSAGSPSVMKPSEREDHVYLIMPMQY